MKARAAFRSTPSTSQTGQVLSTQTWGSGGYELALPAGQYRIIASLNDKVFQTTNVTIGNVNVEQDFVLSNSWQGGTRETAIAAAQPVPVAITPTPAPAPTPSPTSLAITPTPTPAPTTAPAPQPVVSSQPTPEVWVVPLPNYQPTRSQQTVLSLLASSWSAWNAR